MKVIICSLQAVVSVTSTLIHQYRESITIKEKHELVSIKIVWLAEYFIGVIWFCKKG